MNYQSIQFSTSFSIVAAGAAAVCLASTAHLHSKEKNGNFPYGTSMEKEKKEQPVCAIVLINIL